MSRMARKTKSAFETIVAYIIAAALILFLIAGALWLLAHAGPPASPGILAGWLA